MKQDIGEMGFSCLSTRLFGAAGFLTLRIVYQSYTIVLLGVYSFINRSNKFYTTLVL